MKASSTHKPIPRALYAQIHASMPILCVDVLVAREGQVLLVRRKIKPLAGQWWIPGGRMLRGETIKEAVLRICRDEVGLKVNPLAFVTHLEFQSGDDPFGHGRGTCTVSIVHSAEAVHHRVKLDRNHLDYLWWDGRSPLTGIPPVMCTLVHQYIGGNL